MSRLPHFFSTLQLHRRSRHSRRSRRLAASTCAIALAVTGAAVGLALSTDAPPAEATPYEYLPTLTVTPDPLGNPLVVADGVDYYIATVKVIDPQGNVVPRATVVIEYYQRNGSAEPYTYTHAATSGDDGQAWCRITSHVAGDGVIIARIGGDEIGRQAVKFVAGPLDTVRTLASLEVQQASATSNGDQPLWAKMTAQDANGNPIEGATLGFKVGIYNNVLSAYNPTSPSFVDSGTKETTGVSGADGVVRVEVVSFVAGQFGVVGVIDGNESNPKTITFTTCCARPPSAPILEVPYEVGVANGTDVLRVKATVKDGAGNAVPNLGVVFSLYPSDYSIDNSLTNLPRFVENGAQMISVTTGFDGVAEVGIVSDYAGLFVIRASADFDQSDPKYINFVDPPQPPAVTPVLVGPFRVGSMVSAQTSALQPADATLSYQWRLDGVAIPGAIGQGYAPLPSDAGHYLSVTVTASANGQQATATSARAVIRDGLLTTSTPVVGGEPAVGNTVTVADPGWGPGEVSYTYQWYVHGQAVAGATGPSYTITGADAQKTLTVKVTGSKVGYASATVSSIGIGIGPAPADATVALGDVLIEGSAQVGETLTVTVAGDSDQVADGASPVALAYQWRVGAAAIPGATASTYTVRPGDVGQTLRVVVTATAPGLASATATVKSAQVKLGTLTPGQVRLSASPKVGVALTAVTAGWGPDPVNLTYRWKVGGSYVAGATSATYTPKADDAGQTISVVVTGTKAGYGTFSVASPVSRVK
ncbi:MAG: hypothetical protein LBR27_07885 [Bifidobacteriaceae bacterium]|jgi:hypothetical protein|nr:hypothetical protein [Bifidobacteriaceae bacterium]